MYTVIFFLISIFVTRPFSDLHVYLPFLCICKTSELTPLLCSYEGKKIKALKKKEIQICHKKM